MLRGDSMISKFHMPPLVSRDNVLSIEISPQFLRKCFKNWVYKHMQAYEICASLCPSTFSKKITDLKSENSEMQDHKHEVRQS